MQKKVRKTIRNVFSPSLARSKSFTGTFLRFFTAKIFQRTAKGATSKNVKHCQKVSKISSTLFDIFRTGQKTSKIVKKCQQYFRHFLTSFARHQFSGPFWGPMKFAQKHTFSQRRSARVATLTNYLCNRFGPQSRQPTASPPEIKHRQVTDLGVTDLGFSGAQDSVLRDRCSVGTRHAIFSITFLSI